MFDIVFCRQKCNLAISGTQFLFGWIWTVVSHTINENRWHCWYTYLSAFVHVYVYMFEYKELPCSYLLMMPFYQWFTARRSKLVQPSSRWLTFICKQHPVICVDTDREVLCFVWQVLPSVAKIQHLRIILIGCRNLLVHKEEISFTRRAIHANT